MSLFSELRRRNVIRVAIAYLAAVWLLLQVADIVLPSFGGTDSVIRALLISAAIGFPVVLLFAWFYEITSDGVRRADLAAIEPDRFLGRKIDFGIIGLLTVAVVFLIVDNYSTGSRLDAKSIAVLPFVDLSSDGDQAYFARGVSEEIINLLTQVEGLRVVARKSSFSLHDEATTIEEIGEKLNARNLVDGSVRREGDTVRIIAQLIDAQSGLQIWSQTFKKTNMTDIFAIQDRVALSIIDRLPVDLAGKRPSRGQPTISPEAYSSFLKAKQHLNDFDNLAALKAAEDAVRADPQFAEAYELRARISWRLAGDTMEADEARKEMGLYASKAVQLNADLVVAQALQQVGDPDDYSLALELRAFEEAAAKAPKNPAILEPLAYNLRKAGYLGEALAYSRQLLDADPYSTSAHGRLQASLMACNQTGQAVSDMGGPIAALLGNDSNNESSSGEQVRKFDEDNWFVGEIALLNGHDDLAVERFSTALAEQGFDSHWEENGVRVSWVRSLVRAARNPDQGLAGLDAVVRSAIERLQRTPFQEDWAPGRDSVSRGLWLSARLERLYLVLGYLDRYYDLIARRGLSSNAWSNAEDLVAAGMTYPKTGFTAHSRYLETAEKLGIVDVWEQMGPPDHCRKIGGTWHCGGQSMVCAG